MDDLVLYINRYVTDPDIQGIVIGTLLILFVFFGLQLFGWCFGRR